MRVAAAHSSCRALHPNQLPWKRAAGLAWKEVLAEGEIGQLHVEREEGKERDKSKGMDRIGVARSLCEEPGSVGMQRSSHRESTKRSRSACDVGRQEGTDCFPGGVKVIQ